VLSSRWSSFVLALCALWAFVPALADEPVTAASSSTAAAPAGQAAAAAAAAATAAATAAAQIVPPELVADFAATYPDDAFRQGIAGPVAMDIDLDDEGRIVRVAVTSSPDPRLSWAALGALTNFEFLPAREILPDGSEQSLAVRFSYTLTFTIDTVERERLLALEEARRLAEEQATAPVNVVGRVVVAAERAEVGGAVVSIEGTDLEAVTDEHGDFTLRGVPEGERWLLVDAAGFFSGLVRLEDVQPNIASDVTVYLERKPSSSNETVVRERRTQRDVTRRVLTQRELTRVPGTFGDAIRVVQRLPGVSRSPFGTGALLVRGGSPEDSTILIDGHLSRYLFHLGAGPSVINPDFIDRLEFYPGGQGARFGRAIAGAVDVVTRDPRGDTYSAKATVDLLSTGFRLEGPLTPDGKVAFFAAGRTSYVAELLNVGNVLSRALIDDGVNVLTLAPRYADYQAKLLWKLPSLPGIAHAFVLTSMGAHDTLDLALDASQLGPTAPSDVGITQGFHRLNPVYRLRSTATNSEGAPIWKVFVSPNADLTYTENRFDASQFRLDILRGALRAEVEFRPAAGFGLAFGTDDTYGLFTSTADVPFFLSDERLFPRPVTSDPPRFNVVDDVFGTSTSFYVDSDIAMGPVTLLVGGRADLWTYYDEVRVAFDPRFAFRAALAPFSTLKGNVGLYHQTTSPFFIAKSAGNPDLPLERGWQMGLGLETWLSPSLDVDAQVFYRTAFDLAEPVGGNPLGFVATSAPRIQPVGQERAYGAELLVRQRLDRGVFGWVAYTLMRSEERADAPTGIEGATGYGWRSTEFDQTHNLSIAVSTQLPWGFELGGAVRAVTGNPATLAQGGAFDADRSSYARVNQRPRTQRLPAFFQADARLDKRFTFDTWALGLYLDLQNATNAQNFEFFQYNYDFSSVQGLPGLPILPVFGAEASF
jgi:TonB family protein